MIKKYFLLLFSAYFLALIQASFWPHLNLNPYFFNVVLIGVILLNLFERRTGEMGFFFALASGFFLDIFSSFFIGFWVLMLAGASFFIKAFLKKWINI
ncbi:MAG: hypothetical protein V1705_02165 [bacterium]